MGALDAEQTNQAWAARHGPSAAGMELHLPRRRGSGIGKLRCKPMVLDDQVVVTGSFNCTGPANAVNNENVIVIGDLDETDPAAIEAQGCIGLAARREIDRIIAVHCDRFEPRAGQARRRARRGRPQRPVDVFVASV